MKIYSALAIAAILITGAVQAQHANLGIKGGLNLYDIHNDNDVNYDVKTGLHLGILWHIHLDRQFALQPEVLYSAQGAKYNTGNNEVKLKLGYINVPLMIQYMFDNGFRLEAGPQVGFLTSAKVETDGNNDNIKDNLEKVEFALGVGLGYINISTGFGIDLRYNHGLSNINSEGSVKSTNRGIQLGVFYQFQHK